MDCSQIHTPTEALLPCAALWLEYFIIATETKREWTGWVSTEVTHVSGKTTADSAIIDLSQCLELAPGGGRALGDTGKCVQQWNKHSHDTCMVIVHWSFQKGMCNYFLEYIHVWTQGLYTAA